MKATTTNRLVSVIILNRNGKRYLKQCIDSLLVQTYKNIEIILMDNASTDGSVEFVQEHYPAVTVVASPDNLGIPEGNNRAARIARGDYLFLINSDAWLLREDTVSTLVETAERYPSAAIIGCHVLNPNGTLQDIGEKIDRLGFPGGILPPPGKLPKVIDDLFYACACAILIRTSVFWELGAFDGRYFWSHEEVDLAWRARLSGYTVITDTEAMVVHVGGATMIGGAPGKEARYRTTTARIYYRERSTLATLLKNYSALSLLQVLPLYVALNVAEILYFYATKQPAVAYQYIRAYWWNMCQLPETLRARRRIQRGRKVSDRDIKSHFWPGIRKLDAIKTWGIPRIDHIPSGER